jgi:predicted trehalose synthase
MSAQRDETHTPPEFAVQSPGWATPREDSRRRVDGMGKVVSAMLAPRFIDFGARSFTQRAERRESLRVDVVGLACEIATVASLVGDKLKSTREASDEERRGHCLAYRSRALELLAPATNFAALSDANLQEILNSFRVDRAHLAQLAAESGLLLRSWPPKRRQRK